MSPLQKSLQRLESVVGHLEGSADLMETALQGSQRDMFADTDSEPRKKVAIANDSNVTDIANRLDKTIEQVESLLQEG